MSGVLDKRLDTFWLSLFIAYTDVRVELKVWVANCSAFKTKYSVLSDFFPKIGSYVRVLIPAMIRILPLLNLTPLRTVESLSKSVIHLPISLIGMSKATYKSSKNSRSILYMGNFYGYCCEEIGSPHLKPTVTGKRTPYQVVSQSSMHDSEKSPTAEPLERKVTWQSFEMVRFLCPSQNGKVAIVKMKNSRKGKEYAMKIIQKSKLKEDNLLQSEFIQKDIVAEDNPFIVKILHTSQNKQNIYIIMEYLPHRDMYYYLYEEEKALSEDIIRQISAQTLMGLQFLHSKKIIYRQLKPQNMLVTADGHIKLTDYALSRIEKVNKPTMTYVGNIEYTAPEMLTKNKGYNRSADLWSFGVLLYELKFGITPFKGNDRSAALDKIKAGRIEFPSDVVISSQLKDLILKLTAVQPEKRLSLQQATKHPFFQSVNWEDVMARKNETGLVQIIKHHNLDYRGAEDNPPSRPYPSRLFRDFDFKLHEFTCDTEGSFKPQQI